MKVILRKTEQPIQGPETDRFQDSEMTSGLSKILILSSRPHQPPMLLKLDVLKKILVFPLTVLSFWSDFHFLHS